MASPSELLHRLDQLLAGTVSRPLPRDLVSDPDYVKQHMQLRTKALMADLVEQNICTVAEVLCKMLEVREPSSLPFRLCSVGCGYGKFDTKVLEKALQKVPTARLHYLGIDINESTCQEARECFKSLASNVTVEVHAGNIQELNTTAFKPCDLVICINTLYYVTSLDAALENCLKMVKPEGKLVIIQSRRNPITELYGRFWLHQNKTPMLFSPAIKQALTTMGVNFRDMSTNEGTIDLTQCFKDNFQEDYQKHILNFYTHTDIQSYPPAVIQLAKDYLLSIAEPGMPEKVAIPSLHDVIIVINNCNGITSR